jgi:hypothetical protein
MQVAKKKMGKVLELVHVDLCGPITPSTAGGNKYFMLLKERTGQSWRWQDLFFAKEHAGT